MRINPTTQINLNNSYSQLNSSKSISDLETQSESSFDTNAVKLNISSSSLSQLNQIGDNNSLKNETILQYNNEWNAWKDKKAQAKDIRNEHYAKEVAISKTFDNPVLHIKDKYYNESSPYYISDLTKDERLGAYKNESGYLEYGDRAPTGYGDPIILKEIGYMHGGVDSALKNEFNREKVNEQFGQLLDRYNITIPQDTKLTFTIDPYRFKVEVSGTDDINLISKVENAINSAENGEQLFYHIDNSEWENNSQFSSEKSLKKSIYDDIKRETGYELDTLEVVNGKFVTKDGIDIFELTKKNIKEGTTIVPKEFQSFVIDHIYNKLENLAKVGFDGVPDLILSIDYENGSFYDIGQSKNFGTSKTQWIDDFEEKYSAESYKSGYRSGGSGDDGVKEFDKIGIIRNALQEILASKEDDNSTIKIDDDDRPLTKDELIMKYLFKEWNESSEDDFNTLIEELKKDGVIDQDFLSNTSMERDSKQEIQNSLWINEVEESKQSVNIYV